MRFIKIDRVGVELEGGWSSPYTDPPNGRLYCRTNVNETPIEGIPWNVVFKGDGSVRGVSGSHIGEVVCAEPISPSKVSRWVVHNYPHYVNKSCGLHVHMSFKRIFDYERLMNPEFNDFFLKEMKRWGEINALPSTHSFWNRFNGNNHYCLADFHPQKQINPSFEEGRYFTRYTQLNFAAWGQHKTLECRLLPMFAEREMSAKAVEKVIRTVEHYLQRRDTRPTATLRRVVRVSAAVGEALQAAQQERNREVIIRMGEHGLAKQEKKFRVVESDALASGLTVRTTAPSHEYGYNRPLNRSWEDPREDY